MECTADVSEIRVVSMVKDVRNTGIYRGTFSGFHEPKIE